MSLANKTLKNQIGYKMNKHIVTKYEVVDYMTQRGVCDCCNLVVESTLWDEEDRLPFWSAWYVSSIR